MSIFAGKRTCLVMLLCLLSVLQHENEKAFDKLKEVQADAKEKARIMAEENAKLASQLAHLQRQSANHGIGSLVAQEFLQDALGREAKLKDELAEVYFYH